MLTHLMHYVSLKKPASEWAEIIATDHINYGNRSAYKTTIIDKKYDKANNNDLVEYYESLV